MEVGKLVVVGFGQREMRTGGEEVGPRLDMVVGERVGSAIDSWMPSPAATVLGKPAPHALSSAPSLPLILWAEWEGGGERMRTLIEKADQ